MTDGTLNLQPLALPLVSHPYPDGRHGGYRIGQTRLGLEVVLHAHQQGETAEQIAAAFPPVELADVHLVLAWVLRHPDEASAYLAWCDAEAEKMRQLIEAHNAGKPRLTREQLLARKAAKEQTRQHPTAKAEGL